MPADDGTTPEPSFPSAGRDSSEPVVRGSRTPNVRASSQPSRQPQDGGTRSAATQGSSSPTPVRSALLLGSDHTDLEEVTIREITPELAIGISRGRFPKGYPHVDPNEDAAYAATDGTTTIIAVADGHIGFNAALAAITAISVGTPLIIEDKLEAIVRTLGEAAIRSLVAGIPELPEPRNASRTSLTLCALRANTAITMTTGDSACFVVTRRRAKRIGEVTDFLAPETSPELLGVETVELPTRGAIVAATDGFFDFASNTGRTLRSAQGFGAAATVEHLIAAAFSGGAGDNVAIAVYRPSPGR